MGSDLRGRISADTAYNLALSGVQKSSHILDALVSIGIHELQRVGQRSSFKSKFVLQMIEKFAITGASQKKLNQLYIIAAGLLDKKNYHDLGLIQSLKGGNYGLYSMRPLLWLWRFSTKHKKLNPNVLSLSMMATSSDKSTLCWNDAFLNPSHDLILDIGCGMGVCLLNSAMCSRRQSSLGTQGMIPEEMKEVDWKSSNYVGVDLNQLMILYANGIISRSEKLSTEKCIQFFNIPGELLLKNILFAYPGKVSLIMIQFPSPYRLETVKSGGNEQLPTLAGKGFMINEELLQLIADVLELNGGKGKLLFQTKCEDIAIYVKNLALDTGRYMMIRCSNSIQSIEKDVYSEGNYKRPLRVDEWLSSNLNAERAEGSIWSAAPLCPSFCRSETEIACEVDNTFVHRCIMEVII